MNGRLKLKGMGIGGKIGLVVLSTTLLALTVTVFLYHGRSQRQLEQMVMKHLDSIAMEQVNLVEQIIEKNQDRIALVRSRTQLRLSIEKVTGLPAQYVQDNPHVQKITKILFDAKSAVGNFHILTVIDLEGHIIASTEPSSDKRTLAGPAIKAFVKDHKGLLNVKTEKGVGHLLQFIEPLVLKGETIAILIVETDLSDFQQIRNRSTGIGLTEETLIVFKDGDGMIRPVVPFKLLPSATQITADPFGYKTLANAGYVDYRGKAVFASLYAFPDFNWGMIFKIDKEDALRPVREQRLFLIGSLLVVSLLVFSITGIVSQVITKPIVDLTQIAIMIASGDLTKRISRFSRDELGLLAKAFNQMADKLIEANQMLDLRVQEKTHELARANEKLMHMNRDLKNMTLEDGLTQIANRRAFDYHLASEWKRGLRDGLPLGLILIDIDFFKQYNDCLGHTRGDECLVAIANVLNGFGKRETDLAARYGGEEFVMLFPNTNVEDCMQIAARIREAIAARAIPHPSSAVSDLVTVSMGVGSQVPSREGQPNAFVTQVDKALYAAKDAGRNRMVAA